MKIKHLTVSAINPDGYQTAVTVELDENETVSQASDKLAAIFARQNWRHSRATGPDGWERTPEGLPICPKHNEVMDRREKQGDIWHSHAVTDANGQKHYCRGYQSKNSPGWDY